MKELDACAGTSGRPNSNAGLATLPCGMLVWELRPFLAGVILSPGSSREGKQRERAELLTGPTLACFIFRCSCAEHTERVI